MKTCSTSPNFPKLATITTTTTTTATAGTTSNHYSKQHHQETCSMFACGGGERVRPCNSPHRAFICAHFRCMIGYLKFKGNIFHLRPCTIACWKFKFKKKV